MINKFKFILFFYLVINTFNISIGSENFFNNIDILFHFASIAHTSEKNINSFYNKICILLDDLNIPDNLHSIKVKDDRVNELAIKSSKDSAAFTNPKTASISDLEIIIKETIDKAR